MTVLYEPCKDCNGKGYSFDIRLTMNFTCDVCEGTGQMPAGHVAKPLDDGRLIRAATDVARAQRAKGIAKYSSTLEDQNGYTIGGMIDMCAEELADGSVYVQKVREMHLALLDELEAALDADDPINVIQRIINRERSNVR